MKRSAIYSAILHLVIFILLTVGFSNPFSRRLEDQKPLMIEFVDISEFSKAPVITPVEVQEPEPVQTPEAQQAPEPPKPPQPELPKPEPMPAPPPPPEPQAQPQPAPPQPEPLPEPKAEPVPELMKKIEPKKEEPQPKPKPEEPKPEKKKEEPKPLKEKVEVNLDKKKPAPKDDKADKKKKADQDFADLLNDVVKDDKKKDSSKSSGRVKGAPADRVGDVVTASEIDAIRQAMARCWIVPNGARGAKNLAVKLHMKMAKDGTVLEADIVDRGRMNADVAFRAAAESAQRAVLDPKCNPLPLNPEKHDQWKEMRMTFDPKDMY